MTDRQFNNAFYSAIKRVNRCYDRKGKKHNFTLCLYRDNPFNVDFSIGVVDFSIGVNSVKRSHGKYQILTNEYELDYFNCNEKEYELDNYICIVSIFLTEELVKRIKRG